MLKAMLLQQLNQNHYVAKASNGKAMYDCGAKIVRKRNVTESDPKFFLFQFKDGHNQEEQSWWHSQDI